MLYGMASAGTVAWVMYQKFCNGLPYCRQEKDWKQYGVAITRATMANWVIRNSEAFFLPMYEYFHRKLLEREFAMADELCRASHNSSYQKYYIMQRIWGKPVK